MGVYVGIGIVVILIIWYITANNKLVALENNRDNAFADIDVQLKQRHDLIPQLLGAVKGYMDHESEVLTRVTAARSGAMNAQGINDKVGAEIESYPDLKASQNFMQLQTEVSDIENKLAAVRRFFNSATKELNTAIESIPSNIVAGMKKMTTQPMYDLGREQRVVMDKAPEIKF